MTVRWIDDNPSNPELPLWTRGFVAEMLPGPVTPLGWELIWEQAAALGWRDAVVDRLGLADDVLDHDRPELIGVFGGHVYLNISTLRLLAHRTPGLGIDHFDASLVHGTVALPPHEHRDWHDDRAHSDGQLTEWMAWVLAHQTQTQTELDAGRLLAAETATGRPDLERLTDVELVERSLGLRPLCRVLAAQHANQTLAATIGPGIIAAVCDEVALPTTPTELITGIGDIDLASPIHGMWTLSRLVRSSIVLTDIFAAGNDGLRTRLQGSNQVEALGFMAGFEALVAEIGHRGTVEWDLGGLTWQVAPHLALEAIQYLRVLPDDADPAIRVQAGESGRRDLVARMSELAAANPVAKDHFDAAIGATTVFLRGRSRSKANVARVVNEMRVAVRELGERAAGRGDVEHPDDLRMLFVDELEYYADGGLSKVRDIVRNRRAHYSGLLTVRPPALLDVRTSRPAGARGRPLLRVVPDPGAADTTDGAAPGGTAPGAANGGTDPAAGENGQQASSNPPARLEQGGTLVGRTGAVGTGRGRARVVTEASAAGSVAEGEVIVTDLTLTLLSPMLVGAAGVVLDRGGALSHSTIVARELGIPVVVDTGHGSTSITDGAYVEIDGAAGTVTIIEMPPSMPDVEPEPLDDWNSLPT